MRRDRATGRTVWIGVVTLAVAATLPVRAVAGDAPAAGNAFPAGTLVWHLGADDAIETRFTVEHPGPLRTLDIDQTIYHFDATGRIEHVEPPPPIDPTRRATIEPTPFGNLVLRDRTIALVDPESGEARWRHTHESPVNLQYGTPLDRLPMLEYSPTEHFLVLWRCTLAGQTLPGDVAFVLDVETGAIRRVPTIGTIGDQCHMMSGGFVLELRMDRLSRKQTLVCHSTDGKRRWWRTVDDGRVRLTRSMDAEGTPRELLLIMHQTTQTARCRPLVLDAGTGSEILQLELSEATQCAGTLSAAGNLLAVTGRDLDAPRPCAQAGVIDVGAGERRWFRTFYCVDDTLEVLEGRFKVGPLVVGAVTGVMAVTVQWTAPGNAHHCDLWLFDRDGETLARTPVPDVAYLTEVQRLELIADERYVLVRHLRRPSLFALR